VRGVERDAVDVLLVICVAALKEDA